MNSTAMNPIDLHANSLLAATFSHPSEVHSNRLLSTAEKRCVLAAWASDAFAVEGKPWHRQLPGSDSAIPLKVIMAALRSLDDEDDGPPRGGGAALRLPLFEEPKMAVGF